MSSNINSSISSSPSPASIGSNSPVTENSAGQKSASTAAADQLPASNSTVTGTNQAGMEPTDQVSQPQQSKPVNSSSQEQSDIYNRGDHDAFIGAYKI